MIKLTNIGMELQFITFGFACTPLYFVWEKAIGMHECKSLCKRALVRLPVVIPIWFLAIIFPFFGPINSTVGSLLVSFTVYILPALAHIFTFRSPSSRQVLYISHHSFLPSLYILHCLIYSFNILSKHQYLFCINIVLCTSWTTLLTSLLATRLQYCTTILKFVHSYASFITC